MRSGSRHRGEAGGGWLFGFPPLLATDGRIHKGDCDMRTGAIFARGSCRALKWMALFGVVLAMGAVEAAAQTTFTAGRMTIAAEDSTEGGSTTVTVTLRAEVPGADTSADPVVPTPGGTIRATMTVAPLDRAVAAELAKLDEFDATPADPGDWEIADSVSQAGATTKTLDFKFPDNATATSQEHTLTASFVLHTATPDDDAEHEALKVNFTSLAGFDDPNDPDDTPPTGVNSPGGSGLATADVDTKYIRIADDDPQTYVLTIDTEDPMEGGEIEATLEAKPQHVQGSQELTLTVDMPELGYDIAITGGASTTGDTVTLGSADGSTLAVGTARDTANKATISLTTTVKNDGNRRTDTLTLSAHKGVGVPVEDESTKAIDISDLHMLPMITAELVLLGADGMPVMDGEVTDGMVTEGMNYELTLTAVDEDGDAMEAAENLTVRLTTSGMAIANDDYSLATNMITIAMDEESSAPVKLEVDLNDDLDNESLMFSYRVSGEDMYGTETSPPAGMDPASLLSLTIVDATSRLVWVKDGAEAAIQAAITDAQDGDGEINLSDIIEIPKSVLFEAASGHAVQIAMDTSDESVATVYDGDEATTYEGVAGAIVVVPRDVGRATITLTGSAVSPSSAVSSRQVSVDVAEITFDVMVELAVPPVVQGLEADPGDGYVDLSWDALHSRYSVTRYEYDVDASDDWVSAGTSTSVRVPNLTNGTRYVFRVRAVNATGAGESTVGVGATPVAAPLGPQVTVKSVTSATSVNESGGLEVTVTATVPAGTKGADGKVAPIASRNVYVSFATDGITDEEAAEVGSGELTALGATNGYMYTWEKIARTEKASEATYKFRVAVGQDLDAEDEKFKVEVSIDGESKQSKVITIDDAQEQKWELSLPAAAKGAIMEGKSETLTLKADPAKTFDIAVLLVLDPNDPSRYTLGGEARALVGIDSFETTIAAKADSDRADDTVTVTAYTERDGELASLDITVTDANALPAVKATLVDKDGKARDPQPESVMEGETVKVMLTAVDKDGKAMKAAEKLTITLMPTGTADASDYRLSSQSIEIAKDKESSAAVDLMITEDQDIGDETLMFDAAVGGEAKNGTEKRSVAGVLSLMITDGTQKLVYPKTEEEVQAAVYAARDAGAGDDMTFTAGEVIEVMGSALFSSAEGVTLSYTASSSMSDVASASVSGGMVMVTAVAEGMAEITITAHASTPSGVKINNQTDPREASITFPVEVGLEALSIMLAGPEDDMNLAEGMSAMVTATANRAVSADTMVMLMRDRAMSTASDADYDAEAITIPAGETMGSTMVMAVEDNMAEDMEELVLYGMTEGMAGEVTGEVKLYLWDAAVPALPIIAQFLLAAFLAVGGYRRYRRR